MPGAWDRASRLNPTRPRPPSPLPGGCGLQGTVVVIAVTCAEPRSQREERLSHPDSITEFLEGRQHLPVSLGSTGASAMLMAAAGSPGRLRGEGTAAGSPALWRGWAVWSLGVPVRMEPGASGSCDEGPASAGQVSAVHTPETEAQPARMPQLCGGKENETCVCGFLEKQNRKEQN